MKTKDLLAAVYFENKCYVCGKKYGKGFAIHHIRYVKGEKTYKSFLTSESYHEYLADKIRTRREDFALLCAKHHHIVERLKLYKPENLERIVHCMGYKK